MTTLRLRAADRITGALWGIIIATAGALLIAALSGYEIDLELAGIIALSALGGWLLLSALLSATKTKPRMLGMDGPEGGTPVTDPFDALTPPRD